MLLRTPSTCSSKVTKSRTVGGCSGGSSRTASSGSAGPSRACSPAASAVGRPGADQVQHGGAGQGVHAGVGDDAGADDALVEVGGEPHQTGGATKRPLSGSLNDFCATNSFIAFAVPHWSLTSGLEKS